MKKETKKEWTALCRDCRWNGKRSDDQAAAQQELDTHLKSRPQHKVRLLVTGGQDINTPLYVPFDYKKK